MTATMPRLVDPFAATSGGCYADDVVVVESSSSSTVSGRGRVPGDAIRTAHFDLWSTGERLHISHRLDLTCLDNDLAGLLTDELFAPGWVVGADAFERIFCGLVLTSAPEPVVAWTRFYVNTMRRLAARARSGSLADYAPVYDHAASLVGPGSVLELGCCFGFLSLQLAAAGLDVTASDVAPNTVALLANVAPRLGVDVHTLVCDAARVPRPDRCFDTVLAVHLLEHLDDEQGALALAEALRLARRRVVVAVPYEAEPSAAYGHVRVFDRAALRRLARGLDWCVDVHDHHGGWLVLDRPPTSLR